MMAIAIIISTFGCNNGLILAGSRVAYAMAKDGLFFRATGKLNDKGVPGTALVYPGDLDRRSDSAADTQADGSYGNLYSNLLDYVVFAALLFYVLTIGGIFCCVEGPMRNVRTKHLGIRCCRCCILWQLQESWWCLLLYQTQTAGMGMAIVLLGVPVYWLWSRRKA